MPDAPRNLPWELRYQLALQAETAPFPSDEGPFLFPEDPEEEVWVPIKLSQRQFTMLASAVDAGADIAYGSEAISVFWLLVRSIEHTMPLCDLIAQAILTCEDVQAALATVIATEPVIQDAIRDFVISDPAINQHVNGIAAAQVLSLENRLENLLKPAACDPGFVFNQTSVLVQLLHDLTEDVFEAIEVGTNALERGDILISAIPGIGGLLPFDEILQLGDQLAEEVADDYMGAYDEGLYDEIRCGLFCLVKDDCELSIDRAIDWYVAELGETIPDDPVEAFQILLGYLIAGDFSTDAPVYAMHLFCLMAIRLSQNILGIDFGKLGLRITAAGDDSDEDWEILCTDCAPPVTTVCNDLTAGNFTWYAGNAAGTPTSDWGVYYAGQGCGPNQTFKNFYWIRPVSVGPAIMVTSVKFSFNEAITNFRFDPPSAGFQNYTGPAVTEITYSEATHPAIFPFDLRGDIRVSFIGEKAPTTSFRMTEFCYEPVP